MNNKRLLLWLTVPLLAACGPNNNNPVCGDSTVDAGEQCDDGNTTNSDGCEADCTTTPPVGCGDGVVDAAAGEECDDGNNTNGDGCEANCKLPVSAGVCGDGAVDAGEQCDDGNTTDGDGCEGDCTLPTAVVCGDGIADPGEVCFGPQTSTPLGQNPKLLGQTNVPVLK